LYTEQVSFQFSKMSNEKPIMPDISDANPSLPPPPGPGSRPPLDDLRTLRDGPHAFLLQIARQYGDIVRYPVGPLTAYLVVHPNGVKHVLQDNARNYSKDTFQYNLLSSITGRGLLTSDGDFWLRQRRLAQPAFHRQRIAGFAGLMTGYAEAMLARWEGIAACSEPIDVAAEMMHLALQIVGKALFSIEIGGAADELAQATLVVLDHIVGRARTFGIVPQWLPTPGNLRYRKALAVLEDAVNAAIAQRRRDPGNTADLLAMLMSARDAETGQGMTDRQLRDEMMTLLIAGHETVASALAWTWYLLATDPAAEAKLHAELAAVLGGRTPQVDDLPDLRYTQAVFEEALRLYPPAWIITRKALVDDVILGCRVPANALIVASPYVTHRQAALWPDPEAFDPDRFNEACVAGRPRFAYYPFGGGPRLCIGDQFAMSEAKLVIATVAQRCRLTPVPDHPIAVEPGVTLRPKYGLRMRIEPRDRSAGQL
jgi:cytochrome P450